MQAVAIRFVRCEGQ